MNKTKTPFRFAKLMHAYSRFFIKAPAIQGLNNLTEIPLDKPLVIASTHLSDIDVQTIAAFVASYRNVGIASQTSNQRHPIIGTFLRIAGIENVFGITNEYDKKKRVSRYTFNPEDFEIMKNVIKNGKTIIIAAHKPTYDWQLPQKAGKGAVYLAQLAKATILPIALDIQSNYPVGMADDKLNTIKRFVTRKRPNARLVVGEPIDLDPISEEDLKLMIKFYQTNTKNQHPVLTKLHNQGQLVLKALADMLPEEKRAVLNL